MAESRARTTRIKPSPIWLGVVLLAVAFAAGCGRHSTGEWPQAGPGAPARPPAASAVIVTPAPGNSGRIVSVNISARYVVINYGIGIPLPPLEQRLNVYRAGLKVAEIKITGPSRDTNTIGDIVAGECRVGDEVRAD